MATESFIDNFVAEKRWFNQCLRIYELDKETVIDFSPCVCKIPKTMLETKPEAYVPQKLGLGPYHYFRPEFFVNERHKLTIAKNQMDFNAILHFINVLLCPIEPSIRAHYDKFLEVDSGTLCWILTIDSLYLLHLLGSYVDPDQQVDPDRRILAQDILMLENQIPKDVLQKIQDALGHPDAELFYNFCKAHSPLALSSEMELRSFNNGNTPHLLAYMHNLIVNKRTVLPEPMVHPVPVLPETALPNRESEISTLFNIAKAAVDLGVPGTDTIAKPVSLISNLPWDQITGLFNNEDNNVENKPKIEEIEIPSVTELEEITKVKFKLIRDNGGIRDIKFVEEESERTFYLPEITVHSDTEVILRNLVAYEAATASPESGLELAEYLDFMCGIVDTPKDVAILKKAHIINESSSLSDEEIADLFNGINKTTGKFKKKKETDLEMAIERVNEKFDSTLRVKAQRFFKKHVYKSWKFLSFTLTVVLILLLCLQAFCQVYGCSNRWFHTPPRAN